MTYSHTHLVLVAACILLATLLTTNAATAQTTVLDVKDQNDNPLAQINDQGDLTAHGWIEALIGFKFPDGTMQTTAATGGDRACGAPRAAPSSTTAARWASA